MRTEPLQPEPIHIRLQDLPAPFHSPDADHPPRVWDIPDDPVLRVAAGFTVDVFAEGLTFPRWLALTPTGDVLVTETPENRIRLLRDTDQDGVADLYKTFAGVENGLYLPFGMAFTADRFYLGNTNAVLRFPYTRGQERVVGRGTQIAKLPGRGYNQHWTRNVVIAPTGDRVYVSIGSASNGDEEPLPRASVQVMALDGTHRKTFAFGLRNPVGMDFHPLSGKLYVTVNERDRLGDDVVPDYLAALSEGEFYGWPYAYLTPDNLDPHHQRGGRSKRPDLVSRTRTPQVLFQAHSAALGLAFYRGHSFPQKYRQGAFVAFRGSWNRTEATGYKIVFVPFGPDQRPLGYYEDFVTGFLLDPIRRITWGRPVGVLILPDGSVLFTEEMNGRIYRVQYQG